MTIAKHNPGPRLTKVEVCGLGTVSRQYVLTKVSSHQDAHVQRRYLSVPVAATRTPQDFPDSKPNPLSGFQSKPGGVS